MARSMMQGKHLPKGYWAEAVHTAVYILNRSPTKTVRDLTPYEAWHKRKPRVEHLKVFGCVAYAHIPKENREKLDEKGEKCIFIGYSHETKGYRLYEPESKQLIISRDVIFDEAAEWTWKEKETKAREGDTLLRDPSKEDEADQPTNPSSTSPSIPESTRSFPSSRSQTSRLTPQPQEARRSTRDRQPPSWLQDYHCDQAMMALFSSEPQTFQEAAQEETWIEAMNEEIKMIEKNHTWKLVDKPQDKEVIGLKWVYKVKHNDDGSINKYKARLIAKGYAQQSGIDFN